GALRPWRGRGGRQEYCVADLPAVLLRPSGRPAWIALRDRAVPGSLHRRCYRPLGRRVVRPVPIEVGQATSLHLRRTHTTGDLHLLAIRATSWAVAHRAVRL